MYWKKKEHTVNKVEENEPEKLTKTSVNLKKAGMANRNIILL